MQTATATINTLGGCGPEATARSAAGSLESMEESDDSIRRVLPRGRNALGREAVAASQRARLIEAVGALTAEVGFGTMTIAAIVARAGVAKPTFYDHFSSKEACLDAYLEEGIARLVAAIADSLDPRAPVERRISQGISAMADFVAADPDGARVLLLESVAAGEFGRRQVTTMHEQFADFYIALREEVRLVRPDTPPLSRVRAQAIVGAIYEPVVAVVREDRFGDLAALKTELIEIVTILATDHKA